MLALAKGYKQGRAVLYYDVVNEKGEVVQAMAPKATVVDLCNKGCISNAKIQMWEGKAIVRCSNKALPLLRIDDSGNIIGTATQAVRNGDATHKHEEVHVDVSSKTEVVGKITNRRKKETTFPGYSRDTLIATREMSKTISYPSGSTVNDMFNIMAAEFGVKRVDEYRTSFASKVALDKKLDTMNSAMLAGIQSALAVYLMNMANLEIRDTYLKYMI